MTIEIPDETPAGDLASLTEQAVDLVARLPGRVSRVQVRAGAAEIQVEWDWGGPVVGGATGLLVSPPAPAAGTSQAAEAGAVAMTAPLVGVFYSATDPGEPPFVKVGDDITKGQQVGIIEAMKMMNAILADTDGIVTAVHVSNGESVEFDQLLLEIDPS